MKLSIFAIAALACVLGGAETGPALAHHSFSMFDQQKTVTMSGTVKEFEYANPHSWIHLMLPDATGKLAEWDFEMGSVSQITVQGWKRDSVKPGDKLTVDVHPLKDGTHGGQYVSATLADGTHLANPGTANSDNLVH